MFNIKLMSAVGDIIPLQPQIVITLTMFWKTKNIQHKWYLPSARMVLSLRTICAHHQNVEKWQVDRYFYTITTLRKTSLLYVSWKTSSRQKTKHTPLKYLNNTVKERITKELKGTASNLLCPLIPTFL